jgi:ActR/RegA family two-component response regulator
VIICTGYSEILDENRALKLGISAFLRKPTLAPDLAWAFRKAVDGQSAAATGR